MSDESLPTEEMPAVELDADVVTSAGPLRSRPRVAPPVGAPLSVLVWTDDDGPDAR